MWTASLATTALLTGLLLWVAETSSSTEKPNVAVLTSLQQPYLSKNHSTFIYCFFLTDCSWIWGNSLCYWHAAECSSGYILIGWSSRVEGTLVCGTLQCLLVWWRCYIRACVHRHTHTHKYTQSCQTIIPNVCIHWVNITIYRWIIVQNQNAKLYDMTTVTITKQSQNKGLFYVLWGHAMVYYKDIVNIVYCIFIIRLHTLPYINTCLHPL